MSYSLYLWQQPFLNRHSSGLAQSFPFNILLAVVVAHASYLLVEAHIASALATIATIVHSREARH